MDTLVRFEEFAAHPKAGRGTVSLGTVRNWAKAGMPVTYVGPKCCRVRLEAALEWLKTAPVRKYVNAA